MREPHWLKSLNMRLAESLVQDGNTNMPVGSMPRFWPLLGRRRHVVVHYGRRRCHPPYRAASPNLGPGHRHCLHATTSAGTAGLDCGPRLRPCIPRSRSASRSQAPSSLTAAASQQHDSQTKPIVAPLDGAQRHTWEGAGPAGGRAAGCGVHFFVGGSGGSSPLPP